MDYALYLLTNFLHIRIYIYVRMLVYYIYRKQFPNNLICLAREILRNFHNCFQRKKIILNAHIYGIHGKNVFFIFHLYNTEEEKNIMNTRMTMAFDFRPK